MKKLLFYIISIIVLIWCIRLIGQERIYLNVDSNNKEIICDALKDIVKNPDSIKKVATGLGWHRKEFVVYYPLGIRKELHTYDDAKISDLSSYIREYGYSLDNICVAIIIVDIILIFSVSIYFNRKDEWG